MPAPVTRAERLCQSLWSNPLCFIKKVTDDRGKQTTGDWCAACWNVTKSKSKHEAAMRNDAQIARMLSRFLQVDHPIQPRKPWASLSNRDARSLGVHACCNVHRCQFLKEELRRIGNMHLRNSRLVLAGPALECVSLQVPSKTSQRIP